MPTTVARTIWSLTVLSCSFSVRNRCGARRSRACQPVLPFVALRQCTTSPGCCAPPRQCHGFAGPRAGTHKVNSDGTNEALHEFVILHRSAAGACASLPSLAPPMLALTAKRSKRQDFPTPLSPIKTSLNRWS